MIFDISQPVFECEVYPGDASPEKRPVQRMEDGAMYNLTDFSMCAHNGTHVDAPYHFIRDGKTIDQLPPDRFMGRARVAVCSGNMTAQAARELVKLPGAERLLIKGDAVVTLEAARVFAEAGLKLIGVESQSVGPVDAPMAVHITLLSKEIVLLEGIRLTDVPEGEYCLFCAPINLNGCDGAPCRAVLSDFPVG